MCFTGIFALLALASLAWQNPIAAPLAATCLFSEMAELVRMLSDDNMFGANGAHRSSTRANSGLLTSTISVWAATCKDPRYIQLHGYQKTAEKQAHKQEVLAFNMAKHLEQRASNQSHLYYKLTRPIPNRLRKYHEGPW